MGSLLECRIEGFICRLCSQIARNVIHIYTDEGIEKKLEQKINVYLKINLSRFDPLPKVICLGCDAKLEQHHRFIQRVIQNQKKIQGNRPIIPLLEQHLRVRVRPATSGNESVSTNTYNIEAISSSESSSSSSHSTSDDSTSEDEQERNSNLNVSGPSIDNQEPRIHDTSDDSESTDNDSGLIGFNSDLQPVNVQYQSDSDGGFNSAIEERSVHWISESSDDDEIHN